MLVGSITSLPIASRHRGIVITLAAAQLGKCKVKSSYPQDCCDSSSQHLKPLVKPMPLIQGVQSKVPEGLPHLVFQVYAAVLEGGGRQPESFLESNVPGLRELIPVCSATYFDKGSYS